MTQQKAETKHTPGPWKMGKAIEDDSIPIENENGDMATVWPSLHYTANARLIAAAPDLLAALDYLLEQTVDMDLKHGIELTEGETEARAQALAAIAKATNPKP